MTSTLVFLGAAVLDMVLVLWMKYVATGRAARAVVASIAAGLISQTLTILNNRSPPLLLPYLAGVGVGTWTAMTWKSKKPVPHSE